jgi:hypothetical protein
VKGTSQKGQRLVLDHSSRDTVQGEVGFVGQGSHGRWDVPTVLQTAAIWLLKCQDARSTGMPVYAPTARTYLGTHKPDGYAWSWQQSAQGFFQC